MKYPIGIQSFDKIINEGYLYIDKTKLIYDLVHNGTIYVLTRQPISCAFWLIATSTLMNWWANITPPKTLMTTRQTRSVHCQ